MKKEISLEDIFPDKPEFTANGVTIKVRPPNIADQAWLKKNYSPERLHEILTTQEWLEIGKIIYYFMDEEERAKFPSTTATITNEEGDSVQRKLTGPEHLIQSVKNLSEGTGMLAALVKAISISNPIVSEMIKKNFSQSRQSLSTGAKSSTPLAVSTDGKRKK